MAKYKYPHHLVQSDVSAFDKDWLPGQITLNGGIYRCKTCGDEIVAARRQTLPVAHHEHVVLGPVVWQLLIFAQEHPK